MLRRIIFLTTLLSVLFVGLSQVFAQDDVQKIKPEQIKSLTIDFGDGEPQRINFEQDGIKFTIVDNDNDWYLDRVEETTIQDGKEVKRVFARMDSRGVSKVLVDIWGIEEWFDGFAVYLITKEGERQFVDKVGYKFMNKFQILQDSKNFLGKRFKG